LWANEVARRGVVGVQSPSLGLLDLSAEPSRVVVREGDREEERRLLPELVRDTPRLGSPPSSPVRADRLAAAPVPRLDRLELFCLLTTSRRGTFGDLDGKSWRAAAVAAAVADARLVRLDASGVLVSPLSSRHVLGDRLAAEAPPRVAEDRVEFPGVLGHASPPTPREVVVSTVPLPTRRCLRLDGDLGSSPLVLVLVLLLVVVLVPLLFLGTPSLPLRDNFLFLELLEPCEQEEEQD
jgi:hypothetical protein